MGQFIDEREATSKVIHYLNHSTTMNEIYNQTLLLNIWDDNVGKKISNEFVITKKYISERFSDIDSCILDKLKEKDKELQQLDKFIEDELYKYINQMKSYDI